MLILTYELPYTLFMPHLWARLSSMWPLLLAKLSSWASLRPHFSSIIKMKAHYLHRLSLLFITLLLFFMSGKRKSSVVKSGPRIKISRSTDSETPVAQIRNITIHSGPSGRLTQNVSHIPQSEMFSDLPNLLSIEDDDNDKLDMNVDNDTGALPNDIPSNDPEDDTLRKKESKDPVSELVFLQSFSAQMKICRHGPSKTGSHIEIRTLTSYWDTKAYRMQTPRHAYAAMLILETSSARIVSVAHSIVRNAYLTHMVLSLFIASS